MPGPDPHQRDLFSLVAVKPRPATRAGDPDTSRDAATMAANVRASDRRLVLLAHFDHPEGLTDFQLAEVVGRQQTSAGKRRGELRDAELVEATGERRTTPSGARAIVWRLTPAGRAIARALREGWTP